MKLSSIAAHVLDFARIEGSTRRKMGRFFTDDNPSKEWQRDDSRELVMDLNTNRLSGVGLGYPLSSLHFLGRSDYFYQMKLTADDENGEILSVDEDEELCLSYKSMGISISCDLQFAVKSFSFGNELGDPVSSCFLGIFLFEGSELSPRDLGNSKQIIDILGAPDVVDDGQSLDEAMPFRKTMYYTQSHGSWLISLDKKDHATGFDVS